MWKCGYLSISRSFQEGQLVGFNRLVRLYRSYLWPLGFVKKPLAIS